MAPRRTARARWKDPRLLLGIVLVLTSVVVGVRVIASFDDSLEYWALADDVRVGDTVTREQLVPVTARLSVDASYLRVDDELPARLADLRWSGDASAGTLIARDSWQPRDQMRVVEVPVLVQAGSFPHDLSVGDLVDVWVGSDTDGIDASTRVLSEVRVASVGDSAETLAGIGRTVVLAVEDDEPEGADLGLLAAGDVLVVRRP